MAAPTRPARLNRTLLALIGLTLLIAGAFGAAFGLGALRPVLPGLDPTVPLLPQPPATPTWLPWVTIAASVVLGLLSLRWLLTQAQRRPKAATWVLASSGAPGAVRLDTARAAQAVAEDVETYDHVRAASADLTADPRRPQLHLYVTADPSADITALNHRIATHAVARLRRALDADATVVDLMVNLRADRDTRHKPS